MQGLGQHIHGHFSFNIMQLSMCLVHQYQWNRETQYFTMLQEKTSWHAWNLPENGIKWNVESYRSPTNSAQQGIFLFFE